MAKNRRRPGAVQQEVMPPKQLLEVTWLDHEGMAGWSGTEEVTRWAQEEPGTMVSWGIRVHESPTFLVLAASLHAGGWGDCLKILKTDIQEVEVVREWQ